MKRVFTDNREIAHLWMHEAQDEARNPGGNFYFHSGTIYSYGSHFPIARIARNAAGVKAVLFTTRTYSVTTARHLSEVRQALDSSPVFHVHNPTHELKDLMPSYHARIKDAVESIKPKMRTETKLRIFSDIQDIVDEANRFAEFAGIAARIETPDSLESVIGNIEAARKAAEAQTELERKKQETKARRDAGIYRRAHAADLERWRDSGETQIYNGAQVSYLRLAAWPGDLLRFDSESNEIETSRGARVPINHAERAYRFVSALRASGREWKRNGHTFRIGHYAIDSVDVKGNIKAGCHSIEWSEIQALAVRMDWVNKPGPVPAELAA